jgi:hypothetical protein
MPRASTGMAIRAQRKRHSSAGVCRACIPGSASADLAFGVATVVVRHRHVVAEAVTFLEHPAKHRPAIRLDQDHDIGLIIRSAIACLNASNTTNAFES